MLSYTTYRATLVTPLVQFITMALVICGLVGCDSVQALKSEIFNDEAKPTMVKIETNKGDIILELDVEKAPKTVENFLKYVDESFYDNTIFHRVIDNFMIQGGGMQEDFSQKDTNAPVENEANNGLKNTRGTIAMARTPDPHSASSQFFINTVDNGFLNFQSETPQGWGYAVFGRVVEGMDVVDAISAVATGSHAGHQDVPVDAIVIKSISRAEVTVEN